jgi:hypothetical protein
VTRQRHEREKLDEASIGRLWERGGGRFGVENKESSSEIYGQYCPISTRFQVADFALF